MNIPLVIVLASGTASISHATLIKYELSGVLKTYGTPSAWPSASPLVMASFPVDTPYYARFTVDTSRGVIVENTATSRRYNRDVGTNPKFVTDGYFRMGEVASPLYEGTFRTGSKGSFSLQLENTPTGDYLHLEFFNDTTATKFNFTQIFGGDLTGGIHPLGFGLDLRSTDPTALADTNIPAAIDVTKFTYAANAVRFFFGSFFPTQDWVGGGLGGSAGGGSLTAVIVPAPLDSWRASYGPDLAVSSADGLPNLIKFALGLPADVAAMPARLPTAGLMPFGDQSYLTLPVPRSARRTDVTYVVEVSPDLLVWSSGAGSTVVVLDADNQLVVRDALATSVSPMRFIRLAVQPVP